MSESVQERPVVSFPILAVFTLVIGSVLLYLVPNDVELADLQSGSKGFVPAANTESLLKDKTGETSENVIALRQLSEVYEAEGRTDEAIRQIRRLIELRPKNVEYWDRHIRLLEWEGMHLEAARVRQQGMVKGVYPFTSDAWNELVEEYEWWQAYGDILGLVDQVVEQKAYGAGDVGTLVAIYLKLAGPARAFAFAERARNQRKASRGIYRELFSMLQGAGEDELALRSAARYLGAADERVRSAAADTRYLTELHRAGLKRDLDFVRDLTWFYLDRKKASLVLPVFDRLQSERLLDRPTQFSYLELLIELKRFKTAYPLLGGMVEEQDFDISEWRKIAQRLMWAGQADQASRILETLLDGKSPREFFTKSKMRKSTSIRLKWDRLVATAAAEAGGRAVFEDEIRIIQAASADDLKTYELLIETYEAKNDSKRVIATLEKAVSEMERGRIQVDGKTVREYRERLAERYSWDGKPYDVVSTLSRVSFEDMSPKSKAYYVIGLHQSRRGQQAKDLVGKITDRDRRKLDEQLRKDLQEVESGPISIGLQQSGVDAIEYSGRYLGLEFLTEKSSNLFAPSLMTEMHWGFAQSPFAFITKVRGTAKNDSGVRTGNVRLGGEYRKDDNYYRLESGYVFGGRSFRPQLRVEAVGSLYLFDYASTSFELAKELSDSLGLVQKGVSEARIDIYFERRLHRWFEIYGAISQRWTHVGNDLFNGHGTELSARANVGHEGWRFKMGPWFQVVRWNADDPDMHLLMARKQTIIGPFAQLRLGGGTARAVSASIAGGIGADLSADEVTMDSVFLEAESEKLLTEGIGLRLNAAVYTSSRTIGSASYMGQLGVFYAF